MEKNRIELEQNKNPICPHCGNEETDSWELDFGEDGRGGEIDIKCEHCEEMYWCIRIIEVRYTSGKIEDKEGK
jgi:hypothetical protein